MENQLYTQLKKHCPTGYRINEIIHFGYPFRRMKIRITANKSPEKSLQQIYSAILRTIKAGFSSEKELCRFLGLHHEDFLLKELYYLRENNLLDLVNNEWIITETGNEFINNNNILKVIEEDEFEFLIDARKNKIVKQKEVYEYNSKHETFFLSKLVSTVPDDKKLKAEIDYKIKDEEILNGKEEDLRDLYKNINKGKSYMIDIVRHGILFDKTEHDDFILVEYIPLETRKNELDPFIEVRKNTNSIPKDKELTTILSDEYPSILYQFTSSERDKIIEIEKDIPQFIVKATTQTETKTEKTSSLTIWETQQQFEKALKQTKKSILIESPWIKRATNQYINDIENLLKHNKNVVILYGIDEKDEHHYGTVERLKKLKQRYKNFYLIHLPSHFQNVGLNLSGTHRKLVIKDNEYFIAGSFNFLSFNKKEGQKVANEESLIIRQNVFDKWKHVVNEYKLENTVGNILYK